MNSLVSKKLWGQDFFLWYFLIHTKKKKKCVLFLFVRWGFCCFCLEEHCSQNKGLHGGSDGKKRIGPQCGGPRFALWVRRAPGEGHSCGLLPGESQGQRSLVGFQNAGADALSFKTCHTRALRRGL